MKKHDILIADDHEIVRQGLRNILESEPNYRVCAEATNGREALKLAEERNPDVVVLDLSMPDLNGMDAARMLRKSLPSCKIIVFTMHESEQLVQEVFQAGADGYVLKSDAGEHLLKAVAAVLAGEHFFSGKVSEVIFEGFLRSAEGGGETTALRPTTREREILQLLAEGKSNKEVAATLGISVKTAETHRAAIMRKLGFQTISDLVRYAIRNNLIQP